MRGMRYQVISHLISREIYFSREFTVAFFYFSIKINFKLFLLFLVFKVAD